MKTRLVLAGRSKTEIVQSVASAQVRKELPALGPGAMCHMMVGTAAARRFRRLALHSPTGQPAARSGSRRVVSRSLRQGYARSNRSRFITLLHAATKSWTNFFFASELA
jgi:hypothetical protein